MTLADAVKSFESNFDSVESDVRQQFNPDLPVQWSGGSRTFKENAWALYCDSVAAIFDWQVYCETCTKSSHKKLKWLVRPELMEFQITIADKIGRHRAVSNRFAVKSQFVTEE